MHILGWCNPMTVFELAFTPRSKVTQLSLSCLTSSIAFKNLKLQVNVKQVFFYFGGNYYIIIISYNHSVHCNELQIQTKTFLKSSCWFILNQGPPLISEPVMWLVKTLCTDRAMFLILFCGKIWVTFLTGNLLILTVYSSFLTTKKPKPHTRTVEIYIYR